MVTNSHDLLPVNASPLERDLSRSMSVLPRVEKYVPLITTQKRVNVPDSVVPWLIQEYGLGEILPYLPDPRVALREGIEWQRIRGTPASMVIALGWVGIRAEVDEYNAGTERWPYYELNLGTGFLSEQQFQQVIGLALLSNPVRCRLDRIYGGYNQRRFILSRSLLSGGNLLSDDSGTAFDPDRPQQSFGNVIGSLTRYEPPPSASGSIASDLASFVDTGDSFILDWHRMSDFIPANANYPILFDGGYGFAIMPTYEPGWATDLIWGEFDWQGGGLILSVSSSFGEW